MSTRLTVANLFRSELKININCKFKLIIILIFTGVSQVSINILRLAGVGDFVSDAIDCRRFRGAEKARSLCLSLDSPPSSHITITNFKNFLFQLLSFKKISLLFPEPLDLDENNCRRIPGVLRPSCHDILITIWPLGKRRFRI